MASRPKKILIAEDERPLSRALELKFSNLGFRVRTAFDGQEVLDFIKKDKFDVILLDLIMPNMSGFDVLLKLEQSKDKTPIIVTSNLGQEADLDKVKKFNILKYFIKSNTGISEIVEYVEEFLSKNPKTSDKNK